MASSIQDLLNAIETNFTFEVTYNTATGTIKIEQKPEGIHASSIFEIPSDFGTTYGEIETNGVYPWRNTDETIIYPGINNLQSINGVLGNPEMSPVRLSHMYQTCESGFLDLLNIHNVYMHCPNLGHFNSIGVRGENTIIKQVTVSSSFGHLILNSVVSPHDKMDASRQTVKKQSILL